jgi:hypothetical protein
MAGEVVYNALKLNVLYILLALSQKYFLPQRGQRTLWNSVVPLWFSVKLFYYTELQAPFAFGIFPEGDNKRNNGLREDTENHRVFLTLLAIFA